jgi:hypothetical protein
MRDWAHEKGRTCVLSTCNEEITWRKGLSFKPYRLLSAVTLNEVSYIREEGGGNNYGKRTTVPF